MRLRAPALVSLLAASACGAFTASDGPPLDGGADAPTEDGGRERDGGGEAGGGARIHEQNPFGVDCTGWTAGAGAASVTHVPDGATTPGACRVCPSGAAGFSVTGPIAEKVAAGPSRKYTFKAWVRGANPTASTLQIRVGVSVDGGFNAGGAVQNATTWTELAHVETASPGAEVRPVVYAEPMGAAECFEMDDVSFVSSPAP